MVCDEYNPWKKKMYNEISLELGEKIAGFVRKKSTSKAEPTNHDVLLVARLTAG